nr:hypothetical protein [Tanacetum cinerariifolium]
MNDRIVYIEVGGEKRIVIMDKFKNNKVKQCASVYILENVVACGCDSVQDEHEKVDDIFMTENQHFSYETPICKAFAEFNYLFHIDEVIFTYEDEEGTSFDDAVYTYFHHFQTSPIPNEMMLVSSQY